VPTTRSAPAPRSSISSRTRATPSAVIPPALAARRSRPTGSSPTSGIAGTAQRSRMSRPVAPVIPLACTLACAEQRCGVDCGAVVRSPRCLPPTAGPAAARGPSRRSRLAGPAVSPPGAGGAGLWAVLADGVALVSTILAASAAGGGLRRQQLAATGRRGSGRGRCCGCCHHARRPPGGPSAGPPRSPFPHALVAGLGSCRAGPDGA
jgi:hypothetical protein